MTNNESKDLTLLPAINDTTEDEDTDILKHLDELEQKVEHLREKALSIELEKTALLATLQEIQDSNNTINLPEGQKEEIEANTDRLICRCLTIDVCVTTPRNDIQEQALCRVLELLTKLEKELDQRKDNALLQAKSYFNACLSEPVSKSVDQKFQGIVIECTVDDQKLVRKRLKELVDKHSDDIDLEKT